MYVGLDVSQKSKAICVVNERGQRSGVVPTPVTRMADAFPICGRNDQSRISESRGNGESVLFDPRSQS
jgi:hypothetical protein